MAAHSSPRTTKLYDRRNDETALDAPKAGDTIAYGINQAGQIVGFYYDQTGAVRGFKLSGGKYTHLDAPNAIQTQPYGINTSGDIIGTFTDATGQHGFLLHDGSYQSFNVPGTTSTGRDCHQRPKPRRGKLCQSQTPATARIRKQLGEVH
jgi:probable HAF family extracellular repeat protein